jgi:hypothetical protein
MALFAASALAVSLLPARFHPQCGFHSVSGHPCPTCGATRSVLLLTRLHPQEAFRTNPLFASAVATVLVWVGAGAAARLLGRNLYVEVGAREEKWWWFALLGAFLLNWAYLWRAGV